MTSKKVKTKDILGKNYYNYNLSSSNYNPSLNSTITITCIVKNVYGNVIPNKSLQLKQNGTNVGNSVSTNSNGVATWTITCSNGGLQEFSIEDNLLEVFVDNKADANHTHNNYLTSNDINNKVDDSDLVGTFTELQLLFTNASDGDTIVLEKDYKNTDNINITISEKSLMIVGNGHILDGNNANCNIQLNGVTNQFIDFDFQNIIFTNFNYAITPNIDSSYDLHVLNCIFINNDVGINSNSLYNVIENCVFINNTSYGIKSNLNLNVKNCTFWYSSSPKVFNYPYLTGIHSTITGKEDKSNKVTSLSSSSTDTQYPSAKVVYDNLSSKANSNSFDTVTATVTYTDNTSETVTFYVVPTQNQS